MAIVSKICAFMYFDYVEYLRDLLNAIQQEKGCSIRSVQAFLGVKGSGFFTRILDRSRPLSIENAKKIASATAMSAEEASYFIEMVKFGNEKNVDTREILLKKLLQVRSSKQEFALSDSTLQFFGKWYIPVIRDLLPLLQEKSTAPDLAQKIGRMTIPALKGSQVQSAIDYLVENKFVKISDEGYFYTTDPIISTPPRVRSTVLRKYHLKNLEINKDVYDELKGDNRSVSTVTCSMSKESFEKIRLEIQNFREKILAIAREDSSPDRVCHLGIQFMARAIAPSKKEGGDNA